MSKNPKKEGPGFSMRRGKIRDGVVIKVRPETRSRLIEAKRGKETYDSLFNRLLEQVGK